MNVRALSQPWSIPDSLVPLSDSCNPCFTRNGGKSHGGGSRQFFCGRRDDYVAQQIKDSIALV